MEVPASTFSVITHEETEESSYSPCSLPNFFLLLPFLGYRCFMNLQRHCEWDHFGHKNRPESVNGVLIKISDKRSIFSNFHSSSFHCLIDPSFGAMMDHESVNLW